LTIETAEGTILEVREFYENLGKQIRARRRARSMDQAALARRIGLSRSSVTNIEQGRQNLSLHMFYAIADALNLHPQELLPDKKLLRPKKALKLRAHLSLNVANDVAGLYQRVTDKIFEDSERRTRAANEKS
jgi:transcriptional regulator with XRE-family HTH domain